MDLNGHNVRKFRKFGAPFKYLPLPSRMITFPPALGLLHGKIGFEGHSKRGADMLIRFHKQASNDTEGARGDGVQNGARVRLGGRFGTTEQTICKWRHGNSVHGPSRTSHRLQTTLTPARQTVAVVLRRTLLVSLDDLLAVVRSS